LHTNRQTWWWGFLLSAVGLVESGCRDATPLSHEPFPQAVRSRYDDSGPIRVVATVGMVAEMVQEIGGQRVQVETLCGPGVDPHLFKPTRDHVAKMLASDLIVFAGLHLEGKLHDLLLRLSHQRPVYAIAQGLDPQRLLSARDLDTAVSSPVDFADLQEVDKRLATADPHVWMDVSLWASATAGVARCLSDFDPAHAVAYRSNAARYHERLVKLHEEGQRILATVPADQRILVTSHDAFGYFGRAYNFRVEGVQGFSTESEAGLQRINQLVELLVQRRVPAVFVESSISAKNMQALLEGVAARGHHLRLGGVLYADSLGPSQSTAASYVGMMQHNFQAISQGLGRASPAAGLEHRPGKPTNSSRRPKSSGLSV
jgi:manganese/zinc/iron transport system substrate-binding protein